MQYGVDVAIRRVDDWDKLMMGEVAARVARGQTPVVLDIGCGAGGQAKRLASIGAKVTALDILDYSQEFVFDTTASFVQADICRWLEDCIDCFDLVCFQRTLHYLPYLQAKTLLSKLKEKTTGVLYLSVTGATSAIAREYPALRSPLEERFDILEPQAQTTFSITASLCIYHEHELFNLLQQTGWRVIQSRVSDFGNIKTVALSS